MGRFRNLGRLRAGSGTDSDALTWAAAVTSAGGTYSASTLSAVSTFCKAAKASGYWDKLKRLNLFCGDQLAAALVPVKVTSGGATDTNVNFVAGDYTEATGLTGNGSTKYLRTGLIPSASLTTNSTHLAVYNRSSAGMATIGSRLAAGDEFYMHAPFTDSKVYSDQYNSGTGRAVTAGVISTPYGFIVGSRTAAGAHDAYRNGSSVVSSATSGGTLSNVNIECYVAAYNLDGVASQYGAAAMGAYSIGLGLTSADVTAYTTHMEAFQDALGRGVA